MTDDDRYFFKDRQRERRRPQQRYSWLGLVIIVLFVAMVAFMFVQAIRDAVEPATRTPAQARQVRECAKGLHTAFITAHGVTCKGEG